MNIIKRFFDYAEIQTKIASVLPFLTALAYCFYIEPSINLRNSALFFAGMVLFDMTVTMINNYIDLRQAKEAGFFNRPVMLAIIFCAIAPAAGIGMYLSWLYGLAFLLAGMFCFAVGICYTYGPMPISRSPYGELFSGITMGFVIPFLVTEINTTGFIKFVFDNMNAAILFDLSGLLKFGLVCVPLVFCVSNVMLANNICDLEADRNRRYTMPRHIGLKNALRVFAALYALLYIAIIAALALRVIPWTCLFVLATIIPVYRNIKRFYQKQVKAETFVLSVRNFIIIVLPYAACMLLGGIVI
jgi:1,4-dihydroxy-2-naphthoate octaprenyltransferase